MGEKVTVHRTPNFHWIYELQPGDTWAPHPAGGVIVANPERKPLWCHVTDGYLVQEWLEPVRIPWGSFGVDGTWSPNRTLAMSEDEQRRRNREAGYRC